MMVDEDDCKAGFKFINDWPLRRFEILGYSTVVALLLFALARMIFTGDWDNCTLGFLIIPLVIFVPGAAILRIMHIHGLGFSKSAIYSLGLGLMLLMVTGGLLNSLHYLTSIKSPFTLENINLLFSLLLLILMLATSRRDKEFVYEHGKAYFDIRTILTMAFAILLPIVVIIGTTVAGYDGDRSILYYVLVAVCATPLITLSRNAKSYELLVFSLSLSLMLHRGLMTNYLMGYDVFSEFYSAAISTNQGFWDVFYRFGANTAMSMTTLAPMLTNLTSIQTLELLKMVYPFFFSFTGLAVYKAVQGQLGSRPALAASLLFIGYNAFYGLMMQLTKQQIAEVFLLMFFLSVIDQGLIRRDRRIFAIISLFGIVVSHYALAYIAIGLVVGLVALNTLWHIVSKLSELRGPEKKPVHRWFIDVIKTWFVDQRKSQTVSIDMAIAFLAIFFIWFSVTASGLMLQYGENVNSYVGPASSGNLLLYQMDTWEYVLIDYGDALHNVEKYLVVFSMAICIIGVAYAIVRFNRMNDNKISRDFVLFGALGSLIIIGCFTIPRLSYSFYFARFFQVAYIFLSGFLILGLYAVVSFFRGKHLGDISIVSRLASDGIVKKAGAIFLITFLLFNTGTIYYATGHYTNSFALNPNTSWSVYSDSDVLSAKWVSDVDHRGNYPVTADWHRFPIFAGEGTNIKILRYQWTENQTDALLYLSSWNVKNGWAISTNYNGSSRQSYTPIENILSQTEGRNEVVYSTGGQAMIVYIPHSEVKTNPVGPPFNTYEDTPIYVLSGTLVVSLAAIAITLMIRRLR